MKTYIKPSVVTENIVSLKLMDVSAPEPPRVGGTSISGGEVGLDWHKIL